MKWFMKRLSEPSTWAGIAIAIFGGQHANELQPSLTPEFITTAIAVFSGALAAIKSSPNGK